jgi:dihydrofolate reductase
MNHPEVIMIVARAQNGVIGAGGQLPWHIPADLRHFKTLTQDAPMIMGRKTFESLPGLLPGRRHIVLTRSPDWSEEGAETASSVKAALSLANAPRVSIIGGAEIYALFLDHSDRIEMTEIHADYAGDTFFPTLEPGGWHETKRISHLAEGSRPAYDFVTLQRR